MLGITNVFDVNGCKLTANSNNKMSFIAFSLLPKQTNKQAGKTIIAAAATAACAVYGKHSLTGN